MSNHDQRSMYGTGRDIRTPENPPQQIVQQPRPRPDSVQPKRSRGKTIALVAAICLIAAAGIAAVLYFTGKGGGASAEAKAEPTSDVVAQMEAAAKEEGMPKYLSDYDPDSDLGRAHASTRVKLDGVTYVLPCPVQTFLDNGWVIFDKAMSIDDYQVSPAADDETSKTDEGIRLHSLYLKNDQHESSMHCYVANADSEQRYVQNCYVTYIQVSPDCADLEIYGGITFGSDIKDLEPELQKLPSAAWAIFHIDNDSCSYEDFRDKNGYNCSRISFFSDSSNYGKIGSVWIESTDWFWTDGELPSDPDVSAYTAPGELGDDLNSGIVEIGGDLYKLPCPLSAFLDNGWDSYYSEGDGSLDMVIKPMTEEDRDIDHPGQSTLHLIRSDSDCWLEIKVNNYANHPIYAKDSIVVGISALVYDNGTKNDNVVLPGGARIGQSMNSLGLTFTSSSDYMVYEWKTDSRKVRISGKADEGVVSKIQVVNTYWSLGYT